MESFLCTYLLILLAMCGVALAGLVLCYVLRQFALVATFLFGAGGERCHLAVFHLKLRVLRWLAEAQTRSERRRKDAR